MKFKLGLGLCLLSLLQTSQAESIQNPALKKLITDSSRWVILSPVKETAESAKLIPGQDWRFVKEEELQNMNAEVVTLSQQERQVAEKQWSQPFTTRLNQKLQDLCLDLNSNLLTAFYSEGSPTTYVVYSIDKKRQLFFRQKSSSPKSIPQTSASLNAEVLGPKKTVAVPPPKTSSKIIPAPVLDTQPEPTPAKPKKDFQESLQSWLNSNKTGKISSGQSLELSRKNRRRSKHPEVLAEQKQNLHETLMSNNKLDTYKKDIASQGQAHLETTCLEHLNQADKSIMSSSKMEHLSKAYVLNQALSSPNQELKARLINNLLERQAFLNDRDGYSYR